MSTAAAQELITRWIEQNPYHPEPASAWVLPRCVSVWVVIRQLELDRGDVASVANAYELPRDAVEAARAYYAQHKAAIDARIHEHRAFFGV
ncbi:MAG TPA: hypothetical protein VFA70_07645 [Dehalococcoidia bacterium]|jgi:hypothetical protein|nr:hypothetical protein [Dehalococcoidia bacterium]